MSHWPCCCDNKERAKRGAEKGVKATGRGLDLFHGVSITTVAIIVNNTSVTIHPRAAWNIVLLFLVSRACFSPHVWSRLFFPATRSTVPSPTRWRSGCGHSMPTLPPRASRRSCFASSAPTALSDPTSPGSRPACGSPRLSSALPRLLTVTSSGNAAEVLDQSWASEDLGERTMSNQELYPPCHAILGHAMPCHAVGPSFCQHTGSMLEESVRRHLRTVERSGKVSPPVDPCVVSFPGSASRL